MGKDRNTVAGEVQQALVKRLAKKLAYRFGTEAKEGAGLTARGFIEAFKNKKDYDELKAYLYGPESIGLEPFRGTTTGPSHDSMIGSREAREYKDVLNPDGEFVFPASVQPVLEQAADAGSNIYIDADMMPYTGGYRYDAANHPVRITRDENGNLVGSAADIYDFDLGYMRRYDAPAWQVIPMAAAGTPYIVRQDNIPIRFVGDDASEDDKIKASMTMDAWGSAETPHRKKKRTDLPGQIGGDYRDSESIAIENTLLRSGMPILEPTTVMAEYPGFKQYGPGGSMNVPASPLFSLIALARAAKNKYLADYANRGKMFDYPKDLAEVIRYIKSPYTGSGEVNTNIPIYDDAAMTRRAAFAKYFDIPDDVLDFKIDDYIVESQYRPTIETNPDAKYYTFKKDVPGMFSWVTGTHKASLGEDENGKYVSLYDDWDLSPFGALQKTSTDQYLYSANRNSFEKLGAKPVEFYDRIYEKDDPKTYHSYVDDDGANRIFLSTYNDGGSIHIKPSHRGRLTELKARTGKTEAELYNDGNPAHKKMVVFARNSRKWKHADGGLLVDTPADIEYANKWDRISNARYTMANNALLRSGSSKMDADRLARFLAAQSALEAGWIDESKGNNYAGYMSNGKRMSFDSADAFWDYHLKNLDERWPSWRDAQTIDDYYNTVNSTALGLTTKEAFNEYNRKHRDAPAYIYAPDWENENYLGKLQSVYNKYISKYVKPMFDAGGFIQKHGRDKILSVIEKMKQSK